MEKVTVIVGRKDYAEALATQLATNVEVNVYVGGEAEAVDAGEKLVRERLGWDGGRLVLMDGDLEAYPIEVWKGDEATVVGWEVEAYAGTPMYYFEDDDL